MVSFQLLNKSTGETIQLGTGIDFSMRQTLNEIKNTKTK